MNRETTLLLFLGRLCPLAAVLVLGAGCVRPPNDRTPDGRVIVNYWEKWTGFEGEAMQAVVDDFNASQDRILVRKLTVSNIDRKMMLATAGGNPPDVAGLWSHNVPVYAERNALTPLDRMLKEAGITRDDYTPIFWDLCSHRGFMWALPSTPATVALHWNKKMFRDAGLDPDRPPRSIAELERMGDQITLVSVVRNGKPVRVRFSELTPEEKEAKDFELLTLGYTPSEPGWWNQLWVCWFGGRLWDGERTITADSPENLACYTWFQSYTKKYGLNNLRKFGAAFGNFSSPQNPFLAGTVAMILQGTWMYNFIDKYAPQLEWGAAPFPSVDPAKYPLVAIGECDVLVIPHGARHVKEGFEFIKYVNSQKAMEKLNLGQRKFSALAQSSPDFIKNHPNPYIQVFIDLAQHGFVGTTPRMVIYNEYSDEMFFACDQMFNLLATPEEALHNVQKRIQWKFDRVMRRWDLVKDKRIKEWSGL